MKIFYFTSTGNNLFISKKIGGDLYSIPKLLKEETIEYEDEQIGIVIPCYYLGTPRIVQEFFKKAKLKSNYFFGVVSYGNMSAGTSNHLYKIARKAGIEFSYLNEILMVDNYIPIFDMANQIKKASFKNIEANLNGIVSDIHSKKRYIKEKNFLNSIFTFFAQKFYRYNIRKADSRLFVDDSCNNCKTCEKVCPVDNIKVDGKPKFLHHCEECLACTHHCPQNAIRVKGEKSKTRFINENINLKEIIDANN